MIDFHAHVLPGIDDGIRKMEHTFEVLREAEEAGFDKIIATSHYMENFYEESETRRKDTIEYINNKCKKLGINIELIKGSEIYISDNIVEILKNKEASTIGNSKYILIETPMEIFPLNFNHVIDMLIRKNYKVILAHPERYKFVKEDPKVVEKLVARGIYMQSNYASVIGKYGKEAKKIVELLLKHHLIQFMGSDVHRRLYTYPDVEKAIKRIIKITDEEYFSNISTLNAKKVLDKKDVEIDPVGEIEKTIFGYK